MANDGSSHGNASGNSLAEALQFTLSLTPSGQGQQPAQREITTALEKGSAEMFDRTAEGLRPFRPFTHLARSSEAIRQFTPNWFTVTMGTGILALALNQLPLPIPAFPAVGRALWELNTCLFVLFGLLYAARWVFFYDGAKRIFGHSVVSMFFGAIPMGLATIINGFLVFGVPMWGNVAVEIATPLWWIDAVMAFGCGLLIPYLPADSGAHDFYLGCPDLSLLCGLRARIWRWRRAAHLLMPWTQRPLASS